MIRPPGSGVAFRAREGLTASWRRAFYDLRTEWTGAGREAVAIGVGVFIGCTPFFGFHLLICWAVGLVFGLNRLQLYLAANISNPVIAPLLIFSELQAGAFVRRGEFHSLTPAAIRTINAWSFGLDYLVGAVAVGAVLGAIAAVGTYAARYKPSDDPALAVLIRSASDRYLAASITAWEFARGKLRADPIYGSALCGNLLPSGGALVDVGCGQGLMLALLAEARGQAGSGPSRCSTLPTFDRLIGVEKRPRIAWLAQKALGPDAEILQQDALAMAPPSCRVVLFFDVLHLMPADAQEAILGAMAAALEPGGVILVRDADASAGWRFGAVTVVNRLKALLSGTWRQQFHFRSKREWFECFARLGLDADVRPMGQGTPFANVLFRLTSRDARGQAL